MSYEIIIRRARKEDAVQRAELIKLGLLSHQWNAFIYFLFQELTLEGVGLAGAVLFIFCGASPAACAALLPATAALVALAVSLAHHALASSHTQKIHKELFGLVAEARGPLMMEAPPGRVPVHTSLQVCSQSTQPVHSKLVGTVSVSEYCGPRGSGWLHALAVHPDWQRRGVGRSLVSTARQLAVDSGLESLEAVSSHLQHAARTLLHSLGWEIRGTYDRQLLGTALTLPLLRLGLDLPYA
ncbi:unnamed protein product [Parnassius apollo]|uniref:(apollo) hypothetical protein n=1 Tax=Parnassius apollo TaxID=110799 RepID=A0A8S3XCL7_PARAO|nr:unnamed protein product [Parnassius apollo]